MVAPLAETGTPNSTVRPPSVIRERPVGGSGPSRRAPIISTAWLATVRPKRASQCSAMQARSASLTIGWNSAKSPSARVSAQTTAMPARISARDVGNGSHRETPTS